MTNILGLLPLLPLLLGTCTLYMHQRDLRRAFCIATTLWTAWLLLGTELLSLPSLLTRPILILWWLAPTLALLFWLYRRRRALQELTIPAPSLTLLEKLLAAPTLLLLLIAACQAWFSPPNNMDSFAYHLPRQVYWMQHANVAPYPTSVLRQIAMPPLSEFAGLHFMILTGSDQWHNSIQWSALVASLIVVSLIVRELGASTLAQWLAALLVATIPMAFLEASNTKNDLIVTYWTLLATYWILQLRPKVSLHGLNSSLIGLAFGFLVLTKGTGIIFAAPLALWLAARLFHLHRSRALPALLLIITLALLCNAGNFYRQIQSFDTPFPDSAAIHGYNSLRNENFTPPALLSNLLRNIASETVSPSESFNTQIDHLLLHLHALLGIDINDPTTTYLGGLYRPPHFVWQRDEDHAASPFHALLLLTLPFLIFFCRRRVPFKMPTLLLAIVAAQFLLFTFLLKWQVWNVRFVLPMVALLCPLFALYWSAAPLQKYSSLIAAGALLILFPSLNNIPHPLWGSNSIFVTDPAQIRTNNFPASYKPMTTLTDAFVDLHPHTIGWLTEWSSIEYVLERMLLDRLSPPPLFTAFNGAFQPKSHTYPGSTEPDPDAVVSTIDAYRIQHKSTGTWYAAQIVVPPYTILLPDKRPAARNTPLIVIGKLGSATHMPAPDDLYLAVDLDITAVLKGPPTLSQVKLKMPDPTQFNRILSAPAIPPPDSQGIWMLTPTTPPGFYQAPSANCLRPPEEANEIRQELNPR